MVIRELFIETIIIIPSQCELGFQMQFLDVHQGLLSNYSSQLFHSFIHLILTKLTNNELKSELNSSGVRIKLEPVVNEIIIQK